MFGQNNYHYHNAFLVGTFSNSRSLAQQENRARTVERVLACSVERLFQRTSQKCSGGDIRGDAMRCDAMR